MQRSLPESPHALPQVDPPIDDLSNTRTNTSLDVLQPISSSEGEERLRQPELDDETTVSLKVWPCGCDEAPNSHLENFETFQRHVRDGLKNLKSQDVRYDKIEVLMVYWKGGDVPEVAQKARELGELFSKAPYDFVVTPHEIDYQNISQEDIDDSFDTALTAVRQRLSTTDREVSNLLILYYGGHGVEQGTDRLWQPKKSSQKCITWSNYQSRMYNFACDILYLFDCCYSKAMVETTSMRSLHRRRCEILCSSGLKEPSGAQNKTIFTGALKDFLAAKRDDILEGKDAIGGLTFENICDRMTRKDIRDKLIAEPRWSSVNPNPSFRGRITLAKRGVEAVAPQAQREDNDSGYESEIASRSQLSDTRILIKIRLTNPAEGLSSNDWLKWFDQRPHNVAHVDIAVVQKIEWVGVFESDSSLALITVPLWLWHNMEQDPACESLGIVRSRNLLGKPVEVSLSHGSLPVNTSQDSKGQHEYDSTTISKHAEESEAILESTHTSSRRGDTTSVEDKPLATIEKTNVGRAERALSFEEASKKVFAEAAWAGTDRAQIMADAAKIEMQWAEMEKAEMERAEMEKAKMRMTKQERMKVTFAETEKESADMELARTKRRQMAGQRAETRKVNMEEVDMEKADTEKKEMESQSKKKDEIKQRKPSSSHSGKPKLLQDDSFGLQPVFGIDGKPVEAKRSFVDDTYISPSERDQRLGSKPLPPPKTEKMEKKKTEKAQMGKTEMSNTNDLKVTESTQKDNFQMEFPSRIDFGDIRKDLNPRQSANKLGSGNFHGVVPKTKSTTLSPSMNTGLAMKERVFARSHAKLSKQLPNNELDDVINHRLRHVPWVIMT